MVGLCRVAVFGNNLRSAKVHPLMRSYYTCSCEPQINSRVNVTETLLNDGLKRALLSAYHPSVRPHSLGREAFASVRLGIEQQICYYPGKLHGGIQSFFLDQLFADCCQPAVTAGLTLSFLRPIDPTEPMALYAWPVKTDGRKIYMEGCIKVPDGDKGGMVDAAKAQALFIQLKN